MTEEQERLQKQIDLWYDLMLKDKIQDKVRKSGY